MLSYFVEFLGTFIFLSVIINTGLLQVWGFGALSIGLALTSVIFFGGKVSGGMFNPAVSTMFLIKGDLSAPDYIGYVISQILGAIAALYFYKATTIYIDNKK